MIARFAALVLLVLAPAAQPQGMPPALAQFVRTAVHDADDGIMADEVGDAWIVGSAARGFRADFSTRGLRVTGTGKDGTPWTLGLQLVAWGRGDELQPAPRGSFRVVDRRVEIDRGPLTEWYVNDERGVEQGFTLASPPPAVDDEEAALRLVLSIAGGWTPQVRASGRDVRFTRPEVTTVIHYTGLRVWDAEGAEQDAVFVVGADRVCILVDDRGATYPLTVDPWIWTEEAALDPIDDDAGDQVGNSAGVDGDTGVVGAQDDEDVAYNAGAAYVFARTGTTWNREQKLYASDAFYGDSFGRSVSVSGDTVVVGAHLVNAPGGTTDTREGAAYVFTRGGTTWSEQAILAASDALPNDYFGNSVAVRGDTALIGALYGHAGSDQTGAAYVFVRSGTSWIEEDKLLAGDGEAMDQFGHSVSVYGDTALVGAPVADGAVAFPGAAYVFVRSGSTWSQQAKLLANDGESGDGFGTTVSVHGDTVLIGSPGAEVGGTVMGAAYVFVRAGTVWTQQAKLTAGDGEYRDDFAMSVSLWEDTALLGAPKDDDAGTDTGSVYAFVRAGTTWGMQGKVTASASTPHAAYGTSVSLCGDTGLVGAPFADVAGEITGAAYAIVRTAAASAVFRNAGANPASHTLSGPPVMGSTITATIDLASTGHNLALLVGYTTPLTLTLGGGQAVLVNIADPNDELLTLSPLGGPIAIYALPVPSDIAFVGFELSTQALHLGGVQPFALSNAQDWFLGY